MPIEELTKVCSFCEKTNDDNGLLIISPIDKLVFICSICVLKARELVNAKDDLDA